MKTMMSNVVVRTFLRWPLALLLVVGVASAALPPEQSAEVTRADGTLLGTLQMPERGVPVPVALIIAGSGPTDRDGNSKVLPGRNDSLKMLAAVLAEAGVASVRYDKRGIGASTQAAKGGEVALRFETLVDDASAWIDKLKSDARFSKVIVIGHSEGSLIGMLAVRKSGAAAFISLAGPADDAATGIRTQLTGKLPPELAQESERILTALEKGQQVEQVSPALAALYRPSVQPYLISWFRHKPSAILATLTMPVLVVQGDTDIQVGVDQARLLKDAQPRAHLVIVPGMNHVLKQVPADMSRQIASYSDPALPLDPGLVAALRSFLGQAGTVTP